MQQKILIFMAIALSLILFSACNGANESASPEEPNAKVTNAVQTVYAQLTQTLSAMEQNATATPTATSEPTATPTEIPPTETPTPMLDTPTPEGNQTDQGAQAGAPASSSDDGTPCYRANLEYETIPDGTEFVGNRTFTKVWRLKNTGSCPWRSDFSLRFVNGDLMGAGASIPLTAEDIPTWGFVNVEVEMKAPNKVGTYRGYWMITSGDGKIFGIGPTGEGWFWVEIKVIETE